MSVGIVGGGLLGLGIAYELAQKGVEVEVYEADDRLGGLAGSTRIGGVAVDRYYHAVTTTDDRVIALAKDLGLSIRWRPLGVGFRNDFQHRRFDLRKDGADRAQRDRVRPADVAGSDEPYPERRHCTFPIVTGCPSIDSTSRV